VDDPMFGDTTVCTGKTKRDRRWSRFVRG
jgi:hypothetical protein